MRDERFDDTGTVKVSQYYNQPTFDARHITIIPDSWMPAAKGHGCTVVRRVPSNRMKYCLPLYNFVALLFIQNHLVVLAT